MTAAPSSLDRLLAADAIRQLKASYCRFVDTKQWGRLTALFAPDARVEGFGSVPDGSDAAAFVEGVAAFLGPAISIHHVHEPQILVSGPDTARAVWPMMDYVERPAAPTPEERGWIGWGFYEEDYVRSAGIWRIAFMRLARQRMDALTPDHPRPRPGRIPPVSGWI